jgi:hypothetical protein
MGGAQFWEVPFLQQSTRASHMKRPITDEGFLTPRTMYRALMQIQSGA